MRAHSVSGAGLLALFLGGTSAWAQEQGSAYKEVGNVHFAVSCTAAAQEQFDHAVALLHSFFWPETIKAFNAVLATDPTCTMGYWGLAISQRPNPLIGAPDLAAQKRGWEAVEKARTIPPKTPRETDYIGAMEDTGTTTRPTTTGASSPTQRPWSKFTCATPTIPKARSSTRWH